MVGLVGGPGEGRDGEALLELLRQLAHAGARRVTFHPDGSVKSVTFLARPVLPPGTDAAPHEPPSPRAPAPARTPWPSHREDDEEDLTFASSPGRLQRLPRSAVAQEDDA